MNPHRPAAVFLLAALGLAAVLALLSCRYAPGVGGPPASDAVDLERAFPKLRFQRPVHLCGAGDGSDRIFVCEQDGVVRVFENRDDVSKSVVFLDIREQVSRAGNEEGLIGFAFDPDYASNGEFYVHYSSSDPDKVGVVSRFRVSADDPNRADPSSEEVLLQQPQPWRNHNGGTIAFGPDGYLYWTLGDGGAANDPQNNGQDLGGWLGAILRVDVHRRDGDRAYAIPPDNPFVDGPAGAAPEIWAYGLRNVWRFSFDRETGELWAGDVGQNELEEVDLIVRGGNYGWRAYEASAVFDDGIALDPASHVLPVAEYGRELGISITGGAVYRGERFPDLAGRYFYGDYASGNLWSLQREEDGSYRNELVRRTGRSIAAFGEDDSGELFLTSFDGGIYRIVPTDRLADPLANWPKRLSETGLFASTEDLEPAAHLVAYEVNAPFWSDDSDKQRWLALPDGAQLGYRDDGSWEVPVGATIVKHFSKPERRNRPRPLETRLIRRTEDGWEAATYVWPRGGRDASLAVDGQQFEVYERRGVTTWHAPSAAECASCHVEAAGYTLGLTTAQLNRELPAGNQVVGLAGRGLVALPASFDPASAPRYASPYDESAALADRARTWLDVNCAMCHQPDGPGNANIDLRFATPLAEAGVVGVEPAQGDLGLAGAHLLAPGAPEQSLLWHRVATLGDGRMPNVGSTLVDREGTALLHEWILSLRAR